MELNAGLKISSPISLKVPIDAEASQVQLHLRLEKKYERQTSLRSLLQDSTVAGVAANVRRLQGEIRDRNAPWSAVFPLQESGSRPNLFLVHGMFGQAFVSPDFVHAIGVDQPLYGFQARGLDGKEAPHKTVSDMATDYIRSMKCVQPEGPYLLGSLCAGGIVVLEMVQQLRQNGESVAPLLLIDPPRIPSTDRSWMCISGGCTCNSYSNSRLG